ncbi:thioredoxin-like protein [Scheffersomyces xylosifermentans]|uniref:thioredoxin-like protein n=1 Tax=Scheffersomyces xylosifermentans TaxID=1304137 RepID=UPI00315D7531
MASQEYLKKAQELIKANPYLQLSKSWCPDCHYTYRVWDKYNVRDKVHIIELDKFADQDEATKLEAAFTEISGRKWVPTIFFNGKRLGTEEDLKKWKADGSLDKIFRDAKLIQ